MVPLQASWLVKRSGIWTCGHWDCGIPRAWSDLVVCEGTSYGEHRDGAWRAGVPEWGAGRWCDVFEIRDWKIQRCFIYLDPDYAGKDTARYPWIEQRK